MYRPKFCVECGGQIIRLRWRAWTSRKFCEACAPRFLKDQVTQLTIAAAALFFVGLICGHAARSAPPPLLIERSQGVHSSTLRKGNSVTGGAPALAENSAADAGGNSSNSPDQPGEIYVCGARTKKGTPCTRRVHGLVRCWQHKGMPAVLPPEKLRIQE